MTVTSAAQLAVELEDSQDGFSDIELDIAASTSATISVRRVDHDRTTPVPWWSTKKSSSNPPADDSHCASDGRGLQVRPRSGFPQYWNEVSLLEPPAASVRVRRHRKFTLEARSAFTSARSQRPLSRCRGATIENTSESDPSKEDLLERAPFVPRRSSCGEPSSVPVSYPDRNLRRNTRKGDATRRAGRRTAGVREDNSGRRDDDRARRPFAWLTITEEDNDPSALLAYVASSRSTRSNRWTPGPFPRWRCREPTRSIRLPGSATSSRTIAPVPARSTTSTACKTHVRSS